VKETVTLHKVLSRYLAPPIVEVRYLFGALVSEALLVTSLLNALLSSLALDHAPF